VRNNPNTILSNLFILGFNITERAIIKDGIDINNEAKNNFVGVSTIAVTFISLSTLPGTYSSK
jgi:hypothetical protein